MQILLYRVLVHRIVIRPIVSRLILRQLIMAPTMLGLCGLAGPSLLAQTPVPRAASPQPVVPQSVVKIAPVRPTPQPHCLIQAIKLLDTKDAVEIEVEASDRIVPQTQVLTDPDRLVVDFPNAFPGSQLRSHSVDRGEVKDVRVGLFQSNPPVTRVVLDLKTAQSYQVFPSGRTVIIKVMGSGADPSVRTNPSVPPSARQPDRPPTNYTTRAEPLKRDASTQPVLEVTFREGLLGIKADKVTLAEVLFAVQQRTGAVVSLAAGAESEKVVADISPGPAPEVLARLLNGSNFNFLILNAANDPLRLDRVILSVRPQGGFVPQSAPARVQNDGMEEADPAGTNLQPGPTAAAVPARPDGKTPADENTPDQ